MENNEYFEAIAEDGQSVLELRRCEPLGLYAVVAEEGVRDLCGWLKSAESHL